MRQFSTLVSKIKLSPNHSGKRTSDVVYITPHCFVGQVTVERGLEVFLPRERQASCNYVIGVDGRIGGCVAETNRSWCSSSNANDQKAITIECASDNKAPYAFNSDVFEALVDLCVDICKEYKKTKLTWIDNKTKALTTPLEANEMRLTVHRWYANKSCPGDWMYARMGELATRVTNRLTKEQLPNQGSDTIKPVNPEVKVDPAMEKTAAYVGAWTVTAKSGLNMRTGANSNKKIITTIPYGKKVTCYGYHTGKWLLIIYNGITGFVYKQYLKK